MSTTIAIFNGSLESSESTHSVGALLGISVGVFVGESVASLVGADVGASVHLKLYHQRFASYITAGRRSEQTKRQNQQMLVFK